MTEEYFGLTEREVEDVTAFFEKVARDTEANARLIAAAPDLLEAAKAARERIRWLPNIPENVEAMDALDAAIAAAEGEPS